VVNRPIRALLVVFAFAAVAVFIWLGSDLTAEEFDDLVMRS
jgi:hypothetical protein